MPLFYGPGAFPPIPALDGARSVRVKVKQGGEIRRGRLEIVFDERRKGTGELNVGGCRIYFETRR